MFLSYAQSSIIQNVYYLRNRTGHGVSQIAYNSKCIVYQNAGTYLKIIFINSSVHIR